MKKLYMLLDNELRLCITVDRCVIFYKEYDYTESILDQLYSKISAHNVDAAVVVTKGILSFQSFAESYRVFRFKIKENEHSCYVSKFDVNKIINLLNTAGVKNVRVLDKFGYYVSLAKQDCCMIDTLGNAYSIITFRDKIRDISYNSYQNLEKILINCNKKFAVEDFIDMTTYYDDRYVRYFKNVETIMSQLKTSVEDNDSTSVKNLIRTLATLSIFAYSELKISHYFELNQEKINLVNANPIRKEDDYDDYENSEEANDSTEKEPAEDNEEQIPEKVEEKDKPVKKKKKDKENRKSKESRESKDKEIPKDKEKSRGKEKKNKKEKKPASKALKMANVAGILLSIGMLGATYYNANAVTSYTEQIGTLSSQNEDLLGEMDTANMALSEYQGFSSNLASINNYTEMYNTLAQTTYGKNIKTVSYEDGVLKAEVYVKDTTKLEKSKEEKSKETSQKVNDTKDTITKRFKRDLGKKFEVQQLTEEKCDKDGYLLYNIFLGSK